MRYHRLESVTLADGRIVTQMMLLADAIAVAPDAFQRRSTYAAIYGMMYSHRDTVQPSYGKTLRKVDVYVACNSDEVAKWTSWMEVYHSCNMADMMESTETVTFPDWNNTRTMTARELYTVADMNLHHRDATLWMKDQWEDRIYQGLARIMNEQEQVYLTSLGLVSRRQLIELLVSRGYLGAPVYK